MKALYTMLLLMGSMHAFAQLSILSAGSNPASCSNNGSATIVISGGDPIFCYRINGGPCQYSNSRNNTFSGLYSGSYTLSVEDASGNTVSQVVTVGGNYQEPNAWASINGCAILAQASGGLPPYQYAISINGGPFSAPGGDPNFTGVNGSYCIRVYDACNNFTQYCGNIAIAPLTLQAACCSGTNQMCVNLTDNAGNLPNNPAFWIGGLPPYTFTASANGQTVTSPNGNFQLPPACPGWTFTVTDACGNTATATANCLSANVLCINCTDGTAQIEALYGTPPFTFEYQDPSGAWLPNPAGANNGNFSGLPQFPNGGGYVFSFRVRDNCGNVSEIVTGTCLDGPATYNCARGEAYLNPNTDFYPVTVTCNTCTPPSTQTVNQDEAAFFNSLSGNDQFTVTDACGAEIIKTCEEVETEVQISRSCNELKASMQSMYACDGNDPLPVNVENDVTYTLFLKSDLTNPLATNMTGEFGGLTPGATYVVRAVHAICGNAEEETTLFNYGDFQIEYFVEPTSFIRNGVCVSGYNISQSLKPEPDLPPQFALSGGTYFDNSVQNVFKKMTPDVWLLEATNYCVETNINLPDWEPDMTVELPPCPGNGGCVTLTGMRNQQAWSDFGNANGLTIYIGSDYYTLNCPDLAQATTGCEGSWDGQFCNLIPDQLNTVYLRPAVGECPVDTTEFVFETGGAAKLDSVSLTTGVACAIGGFADLTAEVFGGADPIYLEVLDNNTSQILQTIPDSDGDHIIEITQLMAGRDYLFRIVDDCGNTTDALANVIALPEVEIEYAFNCPGQLKLFTDVIFGAEYTWLREDGSTIQSGINLFSVDVPATPNASKYSVVINFSSCPTHTTSIDIQGFPIPEISFAFRDTQICSATPFVLEPIIAAPGNYSFEWNDNSTDPNITISQSGTYIVTVTNDDNNCFSVDSATVALSPPIFLSFEKSDLLCYGDQDGSAKVTPSGGQLPYQFTWSNQVTGNEISNLTAGKYSVTVEDDQNCRVVDEVEILQPDSLKIITTSTDPTCGGTPNGMISTKVEGGVPPYQYDWNNGSTDPDLMNIPAGNYILNIEDENRCQKQQSIDVFTPDSLLAELQVTHNLCFGESKGSIQTDLSGGTPPFRFSWSNNETTQDLRNLPKGDYTLTITDGNGCEIILNASVEEPAVLTAFAETEDITCYGFENGKIKVNPSGGTLPYQITSVPDLGNGEDLAPGVYDITVRDSNNCIFNLNASLAQPDSIDISFSKIDPTCGGLENGSISTTVVGGVSPYQFSWDNGSTDSDLDALAGGNYILNMMDENGCEKQQSIELITPDSLRAAFVVTHNKCFGESLGAIQTLQSGGTAPFQFNWSNNETTQDLSDLPKGDYSLVIKDGNGCEISLSTSITEPPLLTAFAETKDITCFGYDNGEILVISSGGTSPYQITSQPDIGNGEDLAPGNYDLMVIDSNDCAFDLSVELTQPDSLKLDVDWDDVDCHGASTGSASAVATGGTAPYQYDWSNGKTDQQINKVSAGSYTVMAMDDNDCMDQFDFEVEEPMPLETNFVANEIKCYGEIVDVELLASGGTQPYQGIGNQQLTAGDFEFTIIDDNNCIDTLKFELVQPDELLIDEVKVINAGCDGDSNGEIEVISIGGTRPHQFNWTDGRSGDLISNLPEGTYEVLVRDDKDCEVTTTAEITDYEPLEVETSQVDVSCFGFTDGAFSFEKIEGGAGAPYQLDDGTVIRPGMDIDELIAGTYDYVITDKENCELDLQVEIYEPPLFFIEVPELVELKLGESLDIQPFINGLPADPIEWNWTPDAYVDCADCPELRIRPLHSNTFVVSAKDDNGCVSKDTLELRLDRNCEIFFPSGFSPNNDGLNDLIFPFAPPCVDQIKRFAIFDRWGAQLFLKEDFEPNNHDFGWDGTFRGKYLPQGVYVWFVEAVLIDGREVLFKGDLTAVK